MGDRVEKRRHALVMAFMRNLRQILLLITAPKKNGDAKMSAVQNQHQTISENELTGLLTHA